MNTSAKTLESWNTEDRIATHLQSVLQPLPLLSGLTAAGLLIIFWMGRARILETLGWPLVAAAAVMVLIAAAHLAIIGLAARGAGTSAYLLHSVATVAAAVLLTLVWQGIALVALLVAWITPATSIRGPIPRRSLIISIILSFLGTVLILWFDANPILQRMTSATTASFSAVLLLTSMVVLFLIVTIVTQIMRYRTLQARLVGSLVPIIAVPILFTTSVSAYNALTTNQQQMGDTLQAVTSLKRGQLDTFVGTVFTELGAIQQGSAEASSIMHVLNRGTDSDETFRLNASVAATLIRNVISLHPASDYDEVLVLDRDGKAVLSTYILDEGASYGDQAFFKGGLSQPTAQFMPFPSQQNPAGEYKLVAAAPFYGTTQDQILGVVVAVARGEVVTNIMGSTPGMSGADTYLVDETFRPVTRMTSPSNIVRSAAITRIISARTGSGSSSYVNFAGVPVLGYYEWDPSLQAAIVAEVPQIVLATRALAALMASALIGLLTIVIAVIAVLSTSRSISEPVSGLAGVAEHLATGHLTTRAKTDREDEIGKLANSFNTMANQLQTIISDLERRVAERTHDLELQTTRLRTAAEIARDATVAPSLDELLHRAAQLIYDRFEPYHVGIFLLDERRQYAVLQAAPSDAGGKMLTDNFRVRLGDVGVISQVAASGDPALLLSADGTTPAGLGDQYHPGTRSELTLPLKTSEGVIGVLDLQSDHERAFTPADTQIMQVLADQLAAAIERSRLLLRVQERLGVLEQTYRTLTEQSWSSYGREGRPIAGYRYDNVRLDPIDRLPERAKLALDKGETLLAGGDGEGPGGGQAVAVPIQLRGRTLGVIHINFQHGRAPQRTIAMIQQAADRLAGALENVRLLEDSQRRASKERLIGEITSRIGSSINMRNLLQTAVEELGRALPGSDISIDFHPEHPDQEVRS